MCTATVRAMPGILCTSAAVVAPGCTDPLKFADGNPYGVSHVTGGNNDAPLTDVQFAALEHLARWVVQVAGKLTA
jgi:NAD(P)H dehydrogenase (quinone)